jgi:hypothetical protein
MPKRSLPRRAFARVIAACSPRVASAAISASAGAEARLTENVDLPAVFRTRRACVPRAAQPATEPPRPNGVPAAPATLAAEESGAHAFLALEHVDLAIDVLRRHLGAEARPIPAAWLMLLDLCRTHGREQAFREVAGEFHRRCNVCTPTWERYPPERREPGLEAYPRIVRELTQAWGTHECRRLLDRLLYDNRSGERRGFTLNAYDDLAALRRAAGDVLETIEQDFVEESKVRGAHAQARAEADAEAGDVSPLAAPAAPLVCELECQLDADLAATRRAAD